MDFLQEYENKVCEVNVYLEKYLPSENEYPYIINKALRYSVFNGGKRLRPILLMCTYEMFKRGMDFIMPLACAVECIHCYSLVHDDLPAMDNDDYRRGKPTTHKVFGEGMAVLAGDALLNYAYEMVVKTIIQMENAKKLLYLSALNEIMKASGISGMIGGQVVDMLSEGQSISKDILNYIHTHKTGALIKASIKAGAVLGEAEDEDIINLDKYASCIGLAFQIKDDLLDIKGDESKLGKRVGMDKQKGKATYPMLYGIEQTEKRLMEITGQAKDSLIKYGKKASFLIQLADYIATREK